MFAGAASTPDYLALAATFVTPAESQAESWGDDFRWAWRRAIAPELARWKQRKRAARAAGDRQRENYARNRVRALRVDPTARLEDCESKTVWIACACRKVPVHVGCGQKWICTSCCRRYYSKQRKRVLAGAELAESHAPKGWHWTLLRLSVRHSGDVAADRAEIVAAWKRLRAWVHARIGVFPFALVHELTEGDDLKGHHHAHVIAMWPYLDWGEVSAAWVRASRGASNHIRIERARKGARGAAHYAAKYASKGVQVGEFPALLAGVAIANMYGKRVLSASHGFFQCDEHRCEACRAHWSVLSKPAPIPASKAWSGLVAEIHNDLPPSFGGWGDLSRDHDTS